MHQITCHKESGKDPSFSPGNGSLTTLSCPNHPLDRQPDLGAGSGSRPTIGWFTSQRIQTRQVFLLLAAYRSLSLYITLPVLAGVTLTRLTQLSLAQASDSRNPMMNK